MKKTKAKAKPKAKVKPEPVHFLSVVISNVMDDLPNLISYLEESAPLIKRLNKEPVPARQKVIIREIADLLNDQLELIAHLRNELSILTADEEAPGGEPTEQECEYDILVQETVEDLVREVNKRLNDGWQLVGGVFLDPHQKHGQAMIRPI